VSESFGVFKEYPSDPRRIVSLARRADCIFNSSSQQFAVDGDPLQIAVAGTNLCVEIGPGLGANGRPIRIQTCRRNGAPGQRLIIDSADERNIRIRLQNGPNQCVDATGGGESAQLQSWRCASDYNINQVSWSACCAA
jgi:hypothetical protein